MKTIDEQIKVIKKMSDCVLYDTKARPNLRLFKDSEKETMRDACSTLISVKLIGVDTVVIAPELVAQCRKVLNDHRNEPYEDENMDKLQEIINRLPV